MTIICERCNKFCKGCECVPYDVECDENFEPKVKKEVIENDTEND